MAALHNLINQISDPVLRDRIAEEADKLLKRKKFGLVFEEHLPECTPLYDVPVRVGGLAALREGKISDLYTVLRINGGEAVCVKDDDSTPIGAREQRTFKLDELVAAAKFGTAIYPSLTKIDCVSRAPDSPLWHTLIEAENYHALQLLRYLYAGQVDCIYIDPPYNTGAKDWKYNNDYVDANDMYRHSKWLSMMKKRLALAKKLLNPADSVLIVTIDEKEYLHLGCLLEEMFPNARIQMITSMTNKKGQPRDGIFSRCEEYLFVVFVGDAKVVRTTDNMLFADNDSEESGSSKFPTIWNSLLRRGTGAARSDVPTLFYPIFVDEIEQRIVSVGDPLDKDMSRETVKAPLGQFVTWPMHKDGSEGRWQMKPDTLRRAIEKGTAKLGQKDKKSGMWAITYLKRKQLQQVESGEILCEGKDRNGALILKYSDIRVSSLQEPRSIWVRDLHDASVYGSTLIKSIIKSRSFPFPKSLYAVYDTLNFFVANKPNALILDFFAGSGTTLHAVNLLNAKDGGNRRCILVTNNEVSADEAKSLTERGFKHGDEEWEKLGIARYVTWPRTVCSINGVDVNGSPLKGNYLGSDAPMSDGFEANAVYFKLGFLDKNAVSLGRQFRELLPVIWMKSGARGECPALIGDDIPDMLILPQNNFAVLIEESAYEEFERRVKAEPDIDTVYIVTDSDSGFENMSAAFDGMSAFQLYKDYLDNFRINVAG